MTEKVKERVSEIDELCARLPQLVDRVQEQLASLHPREEIDLEDVAAVCAALTRLSTDLAVARAEVASLTAERDALKVDAERLDWMDRDDVHFTFCTDKNGEARVDVIDSKTGERIARRQTLREAIDAARAYRVTREQCPDL